MLFAMVLEREPLAWVHLPFILIVWLQNAGGVCAFGIGLVLLARWAQRDAKELNFWTLPPSFNPLYTILKYALMVSAGGYIGLALLWLASRIGFERLAGLLPRLPGPVFTLGDIILAVCGIIALVAAATPLVYDLITRIRFGRIWAMARLSWKEAIRGRVIWVFGAMALVFLFAEWFLPYKPEDQIRNYVSVVYLSMTVLFLITAGLLGSFSIPNDVKNNSIHTIVTKPVEKFEIVLGRFLGYAGLLTIGLFFVSMLSLIYIVRGVNEEAKKESYKARVPIYGGLHFAGTKDSNKGESVGREWAYRSYISGGTHNKRDPFRQYAIWDMPVIPRDVIERNQNVIFEFAFDIFRLSKGEEGKGVPCTFTFVHSIDTFQGLDVARRGDPNHQAQALDVRTTEMKQEREAAQTKARNRASAALANVKSDAERAAIDEKLREELATIDLDIVKEYKIYQVRGVEVTDYHTQADVVVPPEVFKILVGDGQPHKGEDGFYMPALRVFFNVDTATEAQMVGVARTDFYLLSYTSPFWLNFLKGVIGMWCTHMIVLGVALACSTYLSSVISLLGTMFLFVAGLFTDYLREIAEGRLTGGGPLESGLRLTTKLPLAAEMEKSPTTSLIQTVDSGFGWWIGRIINLIPDITRHDLTIYVANGFDIDWMDVLLLDNAMPMLGYLVPWAVAAYYLMKYREIANPQ